MPSGPVWACSVCEILDLGELTLYFRVALPRGHVHPLAVTLPTNPLSHPLVKSTRHLPLACLIPLGSPPRALSNGIAHAMPNRTTTEINRHIHLGPGTLPGVLF